MPRGIVAAALVYLGIQVLLPLASALSDYRPAPLGWQMFSRGRPTLYFDVTYADGRVERHQPHRIVVHSRDDIPFARLLPPVLCARPGAVLIEIEEAGERRRVRCD